MLNYISVEEIVAEYCNPYWFVWKVKKLTCAFTGHRPCKFPWKYNESDPRCTALKAMLAEQIGNLVEHGVTGFLSGMAEGTDLWCAEIVLAMREKNPHLKIHCILPCKGQADKWPAASRDRYQSILDQADSVVYVSRDYHKNCMLERNRFLVEHAAVLLAVYNGVRRSGTGATVNYARKLGREIVIIEPAALTISHENKKGTEGEMNHA